MSSRNLGEFNYILKDKCATLINSKIKGFLVRKKAKVDLIRRANAAKLITKAFRKYFLQKQKELNLAAVKIQLLFRKNHAIKEKERILLAITNNWIVKKPASRNFAATTIQRYWRLHRKHLLGEYFINEKPKIDEALLKNKFCYICNSNMVTYLCVDCSGNHFCTEDFMKYHTKGSMRNHSYMTVTKDYEKTKTDINLSMVKLKDFLRVKNIALYEHLKLWDFQENSLIKYKYLQDALNYKFFKFPKEFSSILMKFAQQFIVEGGNINKLEECYIKYEEMCIELQS